MTGGGGIVGRSRPGARSADALGMLRACALCPRACNADRLAGKKGFCGAGSDARVAAVSLHHGEEPPLSGTGGSGTVFFSHCNMTCLFCQNYPISQSGNGKAMTIEELAGKLLWLEERGAHNVNFVTPTPHAAHVVEAVGLARRKGLGIPIVYNTNGYESLETLSLLQGVVDIYLPDMKYRSRDLADAASGTPDYVYHNERAIEAMVRQVGPLQVGTDGIARRGVLIRHLVLPGRIDETEKVLAYIRERYGSAMPVSLMGQYFPAYKAAASSPARLRGESGGGTPLPRFERKVTKEEYERVVDFAIRLNLENVNIQEI